MNDAWTDRLSEYLDDELPPAERAAADEHLQGCAHCRAVLDDLRRVTLRAAALRDAPPAAPLWAGVAERIGHAGLSDPAATDELAARRARPRPALRWVAAAAAVLAVGVGIGRTLPHAPPAAPRIAAERPQSDAYRVAAVDHLARSQALLVSFQQRDAGTQASVWADDLLSDTRLLLDSPASDDPRLRRLLQDLELVLVQIAQLGGAPARGEAELARDAIGDSGVLPRMRAVVPAAAPHSIGET